VRVTSPYIYEQPTAPDLIFMNIVVSFLMYFKEEFNLFQPLIGRNFMNSYLATSLNWRMVPAI